MSAALEQAFFQLTPDRILDAVEEGGRRATGSALSLHSLENRVYDVELEDDARVVAKFYRPARWSEEAIAEEHRFLRELVDAEVPAVAPLAVGDSTVGRMAVEGGTLYFALFPKLRGRATEEPTPEALEILGRLIARLHGVGATHRPTTRASLDPIVYGRRALACVLDGKHVPGALEARYRAAAERALDALTPAWEALAPPSSLQRIHADCHHGNLLWNEAGPFFLDFDDFTLGPAVQDLWLVAPGRDPEAIAAREILVEAYEEMRDFDRRTLALVEPLRTLRILRYAGWVAARYEDPAFQRAFPDFHSDAYWQREISALGAQADQG